MNLKRVALVGIPLGLVLAVVGVIGYVSQNAAYPLLWVGLVALAAGIVSAIAYKWRKSPALND
jgi:hypothetical protein